VDEVERQAMSGIQLLEHELIVRDFVAVLNEGPTTDLCAFLTEDVSYRASTRLTVHGRRDVLAMIHDIRATFDEWQTSIVNIAVTADVVLAEHALRLRLPGTEAQSLMSFSSFRLADARISAWHQLHG
jgi:limonene-1,2-epoxide hydrolase